MKTVNHSWWVGGIVGAILTPILAESPNTGPGLYVIIGLVNGVFWGWIIGLIIDKLGEPSDDSEKPSTKSNSTKSNKKPPLRRDGYYLASIKNSQFEPLYFVMFFTSKGFVAVQELEEFKDSDLTEEDYRQILAEGEALEEVETSNNLTRYKIRDNKISMKFYDPKDSSNQDLEKVPYEEPYIYNEWSGKIIPNGLLLDLEVSRFNSALKDYTQKKLINNLKFRFVPISMN